MGNKLKKGNLLFNFIRSGFISLKLEYIIKELTTGKSSSSFFGKFAPNNYQYKQGTIRIFNFKGICLEADISDYVGHYLYFGFEDKSHDVLMGLVNPDFTILDIGTNIGSTLLQFANLTNEKGKVFGFEPDPINYKECVKNIGLNNFKNITVENIGLGNEKGSFNLVVDTETNRGGNRISFDNETQKSSTIINVERLDDWIQNKNISKVDLIKIDVEGFEMNVLKGGLETIKKFKPLLFIELDDNNLKQVGSTAEELIEFLEDLGYSIKHSETGKKITKNSDFVSCHFDLIAVCSA
jgi:FkbM family methyltransferase